MVGQPWDARVWSQVCEHFLMITIRFMASWPAKEQADLAWK
jgi:hypothetical protein